MGMANRAGMTCSGKEKDLTLFTALCNRLLIESRPDCRPLIMDDSRIFAAIQHRIHRQIFSKVSHPATHAKPDHILLNQALVPFIGFRIRKVDHGRRECGNRYQIILALTVFDAITLFGCVRI